MNLDKNIKKNEYGDYVDAQGNVYYRERVLRYRIMHLLLDENGKDRWRLWMSAETMETAKSMMEAELAQFRKIQNDLGLKRDLPKMKIVDNGAEEVRYSLAY